MSHPVTWPNIVYYYAIGNTAPVCLTQSLSPEEDAKVLLLGCGDPRSILYTLHASNKSLNKSRNLDFTCCDIEPATLARNVILFTLIVDGASTRRIWNIFYHFKFDQGSLSLLVEQCRKLMSISDDLDSWSNSQYSTFLRICNRHTLTQLRRHWELYIQAEKFSQQKNQGILDMFSRKYQKHHGEGDVFLGSTSRSAGPFMVDAIKIQSSHFQHYWRTGTVFPDAKEVTSANLLNPTFIYCLKGEGCHLHYGSYPLQCFHLSAAFAPANGSGKSVTIKDIFSCAQSQFQEWCDALKKAIAPGSLTPVTIRLFSGDAVSFCHTLRHYNTTALTSASRFTSNFSASELVLDGSDYGRDVSQAAPTMFNVIDTSNVADHVGLLNVLVTTLPLLTHGPSSTLYTESLLASSEDARLKSFTERLCTNIPAISLLFGVAPVDYLSGFNSQCNVNEILISHIFKDSKQYHERIAWKIPYFGDSIALRQLDGGQMYPTFEPLELAKLLFDIYYHMFQHEDLMKAMQEPKSMMNLIHYDRGTFAALLGFVRSRVQTNWSLVMEHIFDMLHADKKLILGSNFYQDFCCQLHIQGVYTVDVYSKPRTTDWMKTMLFLTWKKVPPMVCLLLVVPRNKVKILDECDTGTPIVQCDVRTPTSHNIYSSIQLVFGTLTIHGSGSEARAVVNKDPSGWLGSSDLVLSVWIPSYCFAIADPQTIQISLGVQSTPVMAAAFMDKLGMTMAVFTANFLDRKYVHVVAECPYFSTTRVTPEHILPSSTHERVSVAICGTEVSTLTAKWTIGDLPAEDVQGEVQSVQASPCAMKVTLGRVSKHLIYPFPINGRESKLRVARKSGWIEVVVPLSGHRLPGGFSIKNFPLLPCGDDVFTTWNVHRLNLDRLPTFDPRKHDTQWVNSHISLGMSDRERDLRKEDTPPSVDVFIHVKETILALFTGSIEPNPHRVFGFSDPSNGGGYTIIFVNRLCLDLASPTLVADACILPLTSQFMDRHKQVFGNFISNTQLMTIVTEAEEVTAWKHLLPAFVERCRTWSHKPTCRYVEAGEIPLTVEIAQNPICACGEGVDLGEFGKMAKWKALAPYVTRCAFSQLFAVSYLENVGGFMKESFERKVGQMKLDDDNGGGVDGAGTGGDIASCARCGKRASAKGGKLLTCGRCKKTKYCGQACQGADWPRHKVGCKK